MLGIYFYRLENFPYKHHIPILPDIIKILIYLLFNAYIPYEVEIGPASKFGYGGLGIVIHPRARVGKNVLIGHQVTIEGRSKIKEVSVIGDNVLIGAGAKILGDVVVGNNSRVHKNE